MGLFKRMVSNNFYGKRGDFPHAGPDVLTAADLQTARDNGINSIRGAKKNMGALRQIQQQAKMSGGIYGEQVRHDYDAFSPFNERTPEMNAASQQVASQAKPAKTKLNRPASMPGPMGNYGKKSPVKPMPAPKMTDPFTGQQF